MQCSTEDGDRVILGGDIIERFRAAASTISAAEMEPFWRWIVSYYFSTQGCNLFSCTGADCFEELDCAAAAACRARMSKKLAIVAVGIVFVVVE